jgi:hypothetical protein
VAYAIEVDEPLQSSVADVSNESLIVPDDGQALRARPKLWTRGGEGRGWGGRGNKNKGPPKFAATGSGMDTIPAGRGGRGRGEGGRGGRRGGGRGPPARPII